MGEVVCGHRSCGVVVSVNPLKYINRMDKIKVSVFGSNKRSDTSVGDTAHEKQLEITKGWSINVDREDYLLGLITNGPSRAQWQKIERLGLRKYFDCLLVSGDLPWEKPDQHIFLEACKMLNVEPRMCIMVGDKLETDIKGGKEAELGGTVWIPLQKDMEASDLPDFTIDKVTELPEVLPNSPKLKRSEHTSNITCA